MLLDRDGRRVILVRGRRTSIQGGNSSPLEDFHHVRLYMRWSMSTDTQFDDQPVWTVALEPRVFWADRSGRILLHPKGLEVASGLDEQRARQVAGEVAYHTGLPILNTAHEHTA